MFGAGNVRRLDTEDPPWMWYYLADCGRWHQFENGPDDEFTSEELEQYYRRNPNETVSKMSCSGTGQVDFRAMLQKDTTGRCRRIKRDHGVEKSCSCFTAAPVFWDTVDPASPYQLILLSELTPEYKTVAEYVVKEGLLDKPIISIRRIQNLDLWEFFCRKKKQLMRLHKIKDIKERRLFHGTDVTNIEAICKYNFDLRLARDHGSYGRGIYFAKHASYSARYSRPWTNLGSGEVYYYMILARVIIGKSTLGRKDLKKPDRGSLENEHDSCVDDIRNPKICVIFDPNQIYPEYVIEFQRKAK